MGGAWWLAFVAAAVLATATARADKWSLAPEVKDTPFTFGDTRIVLHYDSTKNQFYPEHTLKVFRGEQLLKEHKGVGFEQVFASADNRYFLGVSNRGLVKPAWVVFDREGRIIRQQEHGAGVRYCQMSVTLVRVWYDSKKPEPEFKVERGALKAVSVRSCDGKRITLSLEAKENRSP
jgi:hypothetical protein